MENLMNLSLIQQRNNFKYELRKQRQSETSKKDLVRMRSNCRKVKANINYNYLSLLNVESYSQRLKQLAPSSQIDECFRNLISSNTDYEYFYICKLYELSNLFDQSIYLSAGGESLSKILAQCFNTNGPQYEACEIIYSLHVNSAYILETLIDLKFHNLFSILSMPQPIPEVKDTIRELFSDTFYGKKSQVICSLIGEKQIYKYIDDLMSTNEYILEESRPSVAKFITNFFDLSNDTQVRSNLSRESKKRLIDYFIGNLIISGSITNEKKLEISYSLDFISSCLERSETEFVTEIPAKIYFGSDFRTLDVLYLLYLILVQINSRYINKKALICINFILHYQPELKIFLCDPQRADSLLDNFKSILQREVENLSNSTTGKINLETSKNLIEQIMYLIKENYISSNFCNRLISSRIIEIIVDYLELKECNESRKIEVLEYLTNEIMNSNVDKLKVYLLVKTPILKIICNFILKKEMGIQAECLTLLKEILEFDGYASGFGIKEYCNSEGIADEIERLSNDPKIPSNEIESTLKLLSAGDSN